MCSFLLLIPPACFSAHAKTFSWGNLPIDEIREHYEEIPKGKILVTCQVGQRGHAATRLLRELGHDAVNLDGGYVTWSNSPANKKEKAGK